MEELDSGERDRIEGALSALKNTMLGEDRTKIQDATHALNEATQHLAEIVMNRTVLEALAGKNVEDI